MGTSQPLQASSLPVLPAARLIISPAAKVVEGQAVTLSCRSGLSPTPDTRVSWYLNGVLLLEGPSSNLLLPAASSSDAGSYHCRAQDSHSASGPSLPVVLTVLCEQFATSHCLLWEGQPTGTASCPHFLQALLAQSCSAVYIRRVVTAWPQWPCPPRAEEMSQGLLYSLSPALQSQSLCP